MDLTIIALYPICDDFLISIVHRNKYYSKIRKYVHISMNSHSANTLDRWRGFLTSPM